MPDADDRGRKAMSSFLLPQRGLVPWMCPREVYSLVTMPVSLLPAEMHEQSAVVFRVFLDPVIQDFNLFLIEKSENPLL